MFMAISVCNKICEGKMCGCEKQEKVETVYRNIDSSMITKWWAVKIEDYFTQNKCNTHCIFCINLDLGYCQNTILFLHIWQKRIFLERCKNFKAYVKENDKTRQRIHSSVNPCQQQILVHFWRSVIWENTKKHLKEFLDFMIVVVPFY